MLGIVNRGPIPRASVVDPETGEVTPGEQPVFSTQLTPINQDAARAEQRYFEQQRPQIVQIDVRELNSMNRSDDPAIAAHQKYLFSKVYAVQAEVEQFVGVVVADRVRVLKLAHSELDKACRAALDVLPPIQNDLAQGQAMFREAQRHTRDARLKWEHSKTTLRAHPTDHERELWLAAMVKAQRAWEGALEVEGEVTAYIETLEAKAKRANKAVAEAEAAFRASQQRIDQLEGKPSGNGRRSSYSGPGDAFGLS